MSVIQFEPKERLLERARGYVAAPETFVSSAAEATPLLLRALKYADRDLREDIFVVVGRLGDSDQLAEALFGILRDDSQTEDARHDAALHFSTIAERLSDRRELVDRLLADAESKDVELRLHATCALGWTGNRDAVVVLLDRLHDDEPRVRETAVFALTNLRDERILGALLDRLSCAEPSQQRAILFNLWRFYSKRKEAAEVYLRFVDHADATMRFEALVLLGQVSEVADHVPAYKDRLRDPDERVRKHALSTLSTLPIDTLREMKDEIAPLLDDTSSEVKRLTLGVLDKIAPGRVRSR